MRKTIYVKNLKARFHASYGNEKTGGKKQGMLAIGYYPGRGYLYYSNGSLVLREFFGEGKQLPQNMVALISVWEDLGKSEFLEFRKYRNIKAFAVNSDLKCQAICPAYKKEGKRVKLNKEMTCAKCGLCWGKHPNIDIIGCLEH